MGRTPEVGDGDEPAVGEEHGRERLEGFREELAQRDSGQEPRDGRESGTQDPKGRKGQEDSTAGAGARSNEDDPRAEAGESDLDRYRVEVKEKYQSGDEENPDAAGARHAEPVSGGAQEEPIEGKPSPPDPAEANDQQNYLAQPDAGQMKDGNDHDAGATIALELQHNGSADGLPTDTGQNSPSPVKNHVESEAASFSRAGVGEEIRDSASDSNLPNGSGSSAEPPNEKTIENSMTEGSRLAESDPSRGHASETSANSLPVPEGRTFLEAPASASSRDEGLARGSHKEGRVPKEQPENGKLERGERGQEQQPDKTEGREVLATFSATAMTQEYSGLRKFQIRTESFEKKTGIELETGKTYAISGEIEGISEFRKIHTGGSKGEFMAIYAPRDKVNSIVKGEKYNLHIRSVEEISKTPERLSTFYLTPYLFPEGEGKLRFDLKTSSLEKRSGVKLEEGKIYDVRGKIGDSYAFEQKHRAQESNPHIFIWVPKEHAAEFKLGEKQELTVTSMSEQRAFAAVPKSDVRTKLLLQTRTLESLGVDVESLTKSKESDRLLDVTLRKVTPDGEGQMQRVFGKLEPQRGVLLLNIGDAGGKQGDTYEILKVKKLETVNFVNDFNAHRGRRYENVTLGLEGNKLSMRVDGKDFEAKSYSLDANKLRAFLTVEFEPFKKEFSFWFDGETFTAKYRGEKTIDSFSVSEKGLKMIYPSTGQEFATRPDTELSQKDVTEMPQILQGLQLIGENGEIEGFHRFRADESVRSYIVGRLSLARAQGEMQGKLERGSLGEDIAATLVTKLGWTETARHPFSSLGTGRGSEKRGTDSLFRSDSTGELYLVEVKWWNNPNTAMTEASEELLRRRVKEENDQTWGKIRGAYIAIIDYDLRNMKGGLRVKRVW